MGARYYAPSLGRWISEDAYRGDISDPLSLNLYTFVHNNPLIYIDPTGWFKEKYVDDIIFPMGGIVEHGDTLSAIALGAYGDAAAVNLLASINRIDNPDLIYEGQRIILPPYLVDHSTGAVFYQKGAFSLVPSQYFGGVDSPEYQMRLALDTMFVLDKVSGMTGPSVNMLYGMNEIEYQMGAQNAFVPLLSANTQYALSILDDHTRTTRTLNLKYKPYKGLGKLTLVWAAYDATSSTYTIIIDDSLTGGQKALKVGIEGAGTAIQFGASAKVIAVATGIGGPVGFIGGAIGVTIVYYGGEYAKDVSNRIFRLN